jgi:UDP-N-acetylmuramyl pentapeptide phosphotransferase/UDP-N-acetylglucosamine-1-phosphate transferase
LLAATAAAGVVTGASAAVASQPAQSPRWRRRNYRDRDVTLVLGPAVGLGALAGVALAGRSHRAAGLAVVCGAAAVGLYDDLYGDRHARGLRGHALALREGRMTTGAVKLAALVGTAFVGSRATHRALPDVALGTVLVAGGANLVNLFDLRPGRAAKVTLLGAAGLIAGGDRQGRALAAAAGGAALAALPADLGERAMLGDCGAGALGALLGWSASLGGTRHRRSVLAAAVIALTLVSERVSFSEVIERRSALRALDRLGRLP